MELLERAHVLATLSGLLADAAAGEGRLVLLAGEAGIGKTSVVGAFAQAHAGGPTVLTGRCDNLSAPTPLAPLADIARSGQPDLDRLLGQRASPEQVFTAVLELLARAPVVVVIEDAHWADAPTLDLVRYVGRRITATRALVLVTYRDDEQAADDPLRVVAGDLATCSGVRSLSLQPLSPGAVETLASGRHPDPTALHEMTGGNPFYVTEVLAAWPASVPRTIRDAISARIARLSPTGRAAVQAAAVIGPGADHRVLRAVAMTGTDALDECIAKGLLSWDGGKIAFRHELTRSAVLEGIAPARRAELHKRALDELSKHRAGPDSLATLAHHAHEAGDGPSTVAYATAAAEHARRLGAHREAAAQYRRALRWAADLGDARQASLHEAQARECLLTGEIAEAVSSARTAISLRQQLGDEFRAADDTRLLAALLWSTQERGTALPTAAAAVQQLERYPPGPELAAAYVTLAGLHGQAAASQEAVAWAQRAASLAATLGDTSVRARALRITGAARLCGPAEDGWPYLEQALALATGAGLNEETASVYDALAWFGAMHRQFEYFDRYAGEGEAFCATHDLTVHEFELRSSRCVQLAHRGHWEQAAELAADQLERCAAGQVARIQPLYLLGRIRARLGSPGSAALLDEALAIALPRGELQHVGNVRAVRAEAAWLQGSDGVMAAEAAAAYDLALSAQDPWILGELALWLWRGDALRSLPAVVAPHPYGLQISGDWAGAARAWQSLGCPFEQAAALLDSDEEQPLRAALKIFTGLGAAPCVAMAARKLRRLGVRSVPRGPQAATRRNGLGLTRREAQVLELIAAGCTDAQIAGRLFVSQKTVSNHVAAILAKLDVRSRREAAQRLR